MEEEDCMDGLSINGFVPRWTCMDNVGSFFSIDPRSLIGYFVKTWDEDELL